MDPYTATLTFLTALLESGQQIFECMSEEDKKAFVKFHIRNLEILSEMADQFREALKKFVGGFNENAISSKSNSAT